MPIRRPLSSASRAWKPPHHREIPPRPPRPRGHPLDALSRVPPRQRASHTALCGDCTGTATCRRNSAWSWSFTPGTTSHVASRTEALAAPIATPSASSRRRIQPTWTGAKPQSRARAGADTGGCVLLLLRHRIPRPEVEAGRSDPIRRTAQDRDPPGHRGMAAEQPSYQAAADDAAPVEDLQCRRELRS